MLAFHGCDLSVRDKIINNPKEALIPSDNRYDWLGHGVYFWENNPKRAMEYAISLCENPTRSKNKIKKPSVLGAVISLGHCLDFMESASLEILKAGYQTLKDASNKSYFNDLKNKPAGDENELLIRELDCAVIETVCEVQSSEMGNIRPYDSVRGAFIEGKEVYPNAGFREKNHIQICVRNPNCVKGYFLPRAPCEGYMVP